MFCSTCGHPIAPGEAFCQQCGRPIAAPVPPIPGLQFELSGYASRIRALAIVWYVFAGIYLVLGFVGMAFARAALSGRFGMWPHGDMPFGPPFFGPALLHFAWIVVILRAALSVAAAYGLMERAVWGRIVAIVAALVNIIHFFPFGTALAIWTLVTLMGYRNSTLYDQLAQEGH